MNDHIANTRETITSKLSKQRSSYHEEIKVNAPKISHLTAGEVELIHDLIIQITVLIDLGNRMKNVDKETQTVLFELWDNAVETTKQVLNLRPSTTESKMDVNKEFDYIKAHFDTITKDQLLTDLIECGLGKIEPSK